MRKPSHLQLVVGFRSRNNGSVLQSAVDDEEHLDYSAGKVIIVPDLRCWERKLDEATELGQTVSTQDES
jgi:hypothetical protein